MPRITLSRDYHDLNTVNNTFFNAEQRSHVTMAFIEILLRQL